MVGPTHRVLRHHHVESDPYVVPHEYDTRRVSVGRRDTVQRVGRFSEFLLIPHEDTRDPLVRRHGLLGLRVITTINGLEELRHEVQSLLLEVQNAHAEVVRLTMILDHLQRNVVVSSQSLFDDIHSYHFLLPRNIDHPFTLDEVRHLPLYEQAQKINEILIASLAIREELESGLHILETERRNVSLRISELNDTIFRLEHRPLIPRGGPGPRWT
jgi:hypothetical protein